MKAKFILNDYTLIWTLLFQGSVKESIYKLKQKLWLNYKNEYNQAYKDKNIILSDPKNFIPNDDTVYNSILANKDYEEIKKETEKYRREVMKIWDKNHTTIDNLIKNILRKEIPEYTILTVDDELDILDTCGSSDIRSIILGKKLDEEEPEKILCDLLMTIFNKEVKETSLNNQKIRNSIIELAVLNEFPTRLHKRSYYLKGSLDLSNLKRKIYPYWLMYLGVSKDDFLKYMMRDNIAFEVEKYTYERQFVKMDLEEFIDFCSRNKKIMFKDEKFDDKKEEKEQIEQL